MRIVAYRLQAGIGVALLIGEELAEEVGEMGQHFGGAGRAEADRVGHALVFGDAVVGEARGQVEHVAGLQDPLVALFEVGEDAQVGVLAQRAVAAAHLSDFPAPASVALKQEYVVVVEVRTDAAAGSGVADHYVVDPPAGQEAELLQQLGDFRDELVDRLDQQGPVLFRQVLVVLLLERATAHFPRGFPVFEDDARFHRLLQRQPGQLVGGQRAFEVRDRLADQQRFALPVVAEEFGSGQSAQKLQGEYQHSWLSP